MYMYNVTYRFYLVKVRCKISILNEIFHSDTIWYRTIPAFSAIIHVIAIFCYL